MEFPPSTPILRHSGNLPMADKLKFIYKAT